MKDDTLNNMLYELRSDFKKVTDSMERKIKDLESDIEEYKLASPSKGEWQVKTDQEGRILVMGGTSGNIIVAKVGDIADAHLISSTPEMLKALKLIVESCGAVNFSSHNQMREAIESSMGLAEEMLAKAVVANKNI